MPTWLLSPTVWLALALAGSALFGGWQTVRLADERADHNATKAAHAVQLARLTDRALEATEAARAEEARRREAIQEKLDAQTMELERANADAVASADVAGRLRNELARARSASCREAGGNPQAAAPGAPASPPDDLYTDVSRRLDEAADGIARFAEESRARGLLCERIYDSLTP
jgi:hypothetical protein